MEFPHKHRLYSRPIRNDYDYLEIEPMMFRRRSQAAYQKSKNQYFFK